MNRGYPDKSSSRISSSRKSSSANLRTQIFVCAFLRGASLRLAFLRIRKYSSRISSYPQIFVYAFLHIAKIRQRKYSSTQIFVYKSSSANLRQQIFVAQIFVRKCSSANLRPQNFVCKSSSAQIFVCANLRPQIFVRNSSSAHIFVCANLRPQIFIYANLRPQIFVRKSSLVHIFVCANLRLCNSSSANIRPGQGCDRTRSASLEITIRSSVTGVRIPHCRVDLCLIRRMNYRTSSSV